MKAVAEAPKAAEVAKANAEAGSSKLVSDCDSRSKRLPEHQGPSGQRGPDDVLCPCAAGFFFTSLKVVSWPPNLHGLYQNPRLCGWTSLLRPSPSVAAARSHENLNLSYGLNKFGGTYREYIEIK